MRRHHLALLTCLAAEPATAATALTRSPSFEQSIPALASGSANSLAITEAPTDDERHDLLWAAWDQGPPGHWRTRLTLVRREHGTATTVWRMAWPDAYAPTLDAVPSWRYGRGAVVMLQFQYGAAATHIELLGLDAGRMPVRLDSAEAPLLALVPRRDRFVLESFDPGTSTASGACSGWDPAAGRLVRVAC